MALVLHLSDLHLATQPDEELGDYKREVISREHRQARRREIEATLTALGDHLSDQERTLDAVVVTGDVTYQNNEEGFLALGPTLANLRSALPPPERIVVLPGNHDVAWGTAQGTKERYDRFCKHVRENLGYRTPLLEGVDITVSGSRRHGAKVTSPVLDCRDLGFVVVPINSANYCGVTDGGHPRAILTQVDLDRALAKLSENEREAIAGWLDMTLFDDVAQVTPAQFAALKKALRDLSSPDTLVIAAIHHHLLPVSTTEEVKPFADITNLGQTRKFLAENVDVILHGHKHSELVYVDHLDELGTDEPVRERSLVISSGTSGMQPGSVSMRLLDIEPSGLRRTVRIADIAGVQDGQAVTPKDRGSWHLPPSRTDRHAWSDTRSAAARATTVSTCYQAVMGMFEERRLPGGERVDVTISNLKCTVLDGASCHDLPDGYPEVPGRWPGWFPQTVDWWQGTERSEGSGYDFTHGERLYEHMGWLDQIEAAAKVLAKDSATTRGTMTLMEPARDLHSGLAFPSFCLVQPHIIDGALHVSGTFRKQEMHFWWPVNVAELAAIQEQLKEGIERHSEMVIEIGSITTVTEFAVFSDTPPKAVVPFLDFFDDEGIREDRIVAMAYAAVHGSSETSAGVADDWRLVQEQWKPARSPAADADPVSVTGTERLARLVRLFEVQKGMEPRLAGHLDKIAVANRVFADRQKDPRPERKAAFEKWQHDLDEILPKAAGLIKKRLAT